VGPELASTRSVADRWDRGSQTKRPPFSPMKPAIGACSLRQPSSKALVECSGEAKPWTHSPDSVTGCKNLGVYCIPMQAKDYATVIVAIVVPYLAYQLAMRQDQRKWARDKRAELYVDIFTRQAVDRHLLAPEAEVAEGNRSDFLDENRLLLARIQAFASRRVREQYVFYVNVIADFQDNPDDERKMVSAVRTFNELSGLMRRELTSDRRILPRLGNVS
jgi:hypothetical protein